MPIDDAVGDGRCPVVDSNASTSKRTRRRRLAILTSSRSLARLSLAPYNNLVDDSNHWLNQIAHATRNFNAPMKASCLHRGYILCQGNLCCTSHFLVHFH